MRTFLFLLISFSVFYAHADAEITKIDRISLTVSDLARTEAFFHDGLCFEKVAVKEITDPSYSHLVGVQGAKVTIMTMRVGTSLVDFVKYSKPGLPYPKGSTSPDLWFQHIAIVVPDIDKAYSHLKKVKFEAISLNGPETLPPSTGSVAAFKFRDPDGHPLELLYFPNGQGREVWHKQPPERLFLGLDHSAISISSTKNSLNYYTNLIGMKWAYYSLNHGITQEQLDGTFNAEVQITGIRPPNGLGIGMELLDYRAPSTGRPIPKNVKCNDIQNDQVEMVTDNIEKVDEALWKAGVDYISPRIVTLKGDGPFHKALMVRDPDGHAILVEQ